MKLVKLWFLGSILLAMQATFSSDSRDYIELDTVSSLDEMVEFNIFDRDCTNDLIFYLLAPDKFENLRNYVESYPECLEALECDIVENPLYFAVGYSDNKKTVEFLLQKGMYPYSVPHHGIDNEYADIFGRYTD